MATMAATMAGATATQPEQADFGFSRVGARRPGLLPDPKHVWMVFRRRVWLFTLVAILVASAVAAGVAFTRPVFTATASVLIEPRKTETIDLQSVAQGLPADTNAVDTQVQIISSPSTALAVVRRLRLDREPDFTGAARPGSPADNAGDSAGMTAAERRAVQIVQSIVSVRRAGLTYVIDITARSRNAQRAADVANAYAGEYIALQAAHRSGVNEQATDFVTRRAEELRRQAVADDAAVQRYMIANNLLSAEGATMAEQEASQINQQITQAQATLAQERGKLAAARAQLSRGGGSDIGAVLASDTIRTLRAQEATASAEVASLRSRYGESHPDLKRARQNLADIREQLAAEQERIVSTLQANVQVAESGLASLESSRARSRASLASNSAAQVGLLELQRKAEASRAIYSAFLQRAKETAATANLPLADASISSMARLPDYPIWPDYRLAALVGLVAAVLSGLVAIGVAEYLDGTIATREDVEGELGVAYAGAIPDLASSAGRENRHTPPHLYILSHPFSVFAEAVRAVGVVARRRSDGAGRVVTIASALPREGKTTLSICLARILAVGGARVLLVDADLRRHSVSSMLLPELERDERLLRVLDGSLTLDAAIVRDPMSDLMILPTCGPTSTENFMTDERIIPFFAELRQRFDVVIVDTAPVLGVVDTRPLAAHADATLLICRWRRTAVKAARAAVDVLDQAGARVVGTALSVVDIRQYASTGHADAYGYHKKFAGYYVS